MDDAALVLFSGGQDSTVCLAWALGRYARVETIGFHYGQRHAVEMQCRTKLLHHLRTEFSQWAGKLGADTVLELDVIREVSESALTRDAEITMGANKLPTTFVPGRNLLFFTTAAALAYRRGIKVLVTLKALQVTLNLGLERRFVIETPLMWIDKAATWRLAEELGGKTLVQLIIEHTHSCYRGDRTERHAWGYGCGACPACELRARGYKRFRESGSEP